MKYKLRSWIDEEKLIKDVLEKNPIHCDYKKEKKYDNSLFINWLYENELSKDPNSIEYLDKNVNKINWSVLLSQNPRGYILGMKYFDIIPQHYKELLCRYVEAFEFVIERWDKIKGPRKWFYMCQNAKGIDFLENHQEHIDWYALSINPGIYEYDYKKESKKKMDIIRMELMERTWHPDRYQEWCI